MNDNSCGLSLRILRSKVLVYCVAELVALLQLIFLLTSTIIACFLERTKRKNIKKQKNMWLFEIVLPMLAVCLVMLSSHIDALSSNCFYLPNIALNGGTYDEFPSAEIKFCCMACAKNPCCIAYTFDRVQKRCYMKAAISDSYTASTMTSGLKANTHSGQGSILRNVKIHGGMASSIKLPNSEDCMQYCTAYGIFSWSPASSGVSSSSSNVVEAEAASTNGDCSCMSRISSLEYAFGSRSAIFPPVSNL